MSTDAVRPAMTPSTVTGATVGGGAAPTTTRRVAGTGCAPATPTVTVPVAPGCAAPPASRCRVRVPKPERLTSDGCSFQVAVYSMSASFASSATQTWHSEVTGTSTRSPPSTTVIGVAGQRRTGVSGPICTGTVITPNWPFGSVRLVPLVTWKAIAAGPT